MQAALSLMILGFGKRKEKGSEKEQGGDTGVLSGFRSGISDEVHGGHLEDGFLVLSPSLGGGRYPVREAGDWIDDSGCRLVYQPMDMKGRKSGPLMVTTNLISRIVLENVCRADGLTGMLSGYVPDRGTAIQVMSSAGVVEPLDYPFSIDVMSFSAASIRRRRWGPGELVGPMCLYGPIISSEQFDNGGSNDIRMDYIAGFHVSDRGMTLSSDLGDLCFRPSVESLDDVSDGAFRLMLDMGRMEGMEKDIIITDADIPREIAVNILGDSIRLGVLTLYTPSEGDAASLVSEATGEKRPVKVTGSTEYGGRSYYVLPARKGLNARVVFGPRVDASLQ